MRGGISMVCKRYAKANNPLVEGYNPAEPTNYITHLDANNLYGWAMRLPLPKSGFHYWKRVMPTEEQIIKMKWNSKKRWILEVDLEYPEELHGTHKQKANVRIPAASYGRPAFDYAEYREVGADAGGQREVCAPLQEPAVLSKSGNASEEGAPSVRVQPGSLDGTIHQDEHGVSQAGKKRF